MWCEKVDFVKNECKWGEIMTIKGLARREGCTDSNPGDVGWNVRAEEAN